MEYRTMTRKEIAIELNISYPTLYRRIKKYLDPVFQEDIKGKALLFPNQVKFIVENLDSVKASDKGLGKEEMEKLKNR